MSSNNKKPTGVKDDKKTSSSKEESPAGGKDDGGSGSAGGSNGAASVEPSQPGSKPGSAGATAREGAQRLLGLASRGEWAPCDQLLKTLEKSVQSAGEDGYTTPLAGVMDPVGLFAHSILSLQNFGLSFTKEIDYFQTTGMSPLMYAVKDNRTAFLDRMIDLGADVGARNNVRDNETHYLHIIN